MTYVDRNGWRHSLGGPRGRHAHWPAHIVTSKPSARKTVRTPLQLFMYLRSTR
jgi:hypothetical protein